MKDYDNNNHRPFTLSPPSKAKHSHKDDECEYLLREGHRIYQQSLETFREGDSLILINLRDKIKEALCLIAEKEKLDEKGFALENKALAILDKYKVKCTCHSEEKDAECEPILNKAFKFYGKESEILDGIERMLNDILCCLIDYGEADRLGDDYFDRWVDCMHQEYRCVHNN